MCVIGRGVREHAALPGRHLVPVVEVRELLQRTAYIIPLLLHRRLQHSLEVILLQDQQFHGRFFEHVGG